MSTHFMQTLQPEIHTRETIEVFVGRCLIKSPAAGLKQANAAAREEEMEDDTEIDTSITMKVKQKVRPREEAKLEEIHESDHEMEEN